MSKATEVVRKLNNRGLTPAEIRARRAAIAIADPDVYPTPSGQFVRVPSSRHEITVVHTRHIVHETTTIHAEVVGEASQGEWD